LLRDGKQHYGRTASALPWRYFGYRKDIELNNSSMKTNYTIKLDYASCSRWSTCFFNTIEGPHVASGSPKRLLRLLLESLWTNKLYSDISSLWWVPAVNSKLSRRLPDGKQHAKQQVISKCRQIIGRVNLKTAVSCEGSSHLGSLIISWHKSQLYVHYKESKEWKIAMFKNEVLKRLRRKRTHLFELQ